jgi:cyclic-di-AMP phosphodiesterase
MNRKKFGIFMPKTNFYIWIIFIFAAVMIFLRWQLAIPSFIILAVLIYHNIDSNIKRQKVITKYIENFIFNVNSKKETRNALLNFPIPLVIMELDGTIIWYNLSLKKIFNRDEHLNKTLGSFVDGMNTDEMKEKKLAISEQIVINKRHYNMIGNFIKIEAKHNITEYILVFYFIDNTDLIEIKNKYENEQIITGIIVIDNYDDLMQSMDESIRSHLLAEISKRILQWSEFTGGIIKKFERDRYLFIFEKQYLKTIQENKFSILDSVKEIEMDNKIPVTLSIGLGINADNLAESFSYASAAIDIALGRGGDQAVLKDRGNFNFFGGKTRELEKRTRVKARVMAYALRELIDHSSDVLIMGHENADLDLIGSALGIYRIAKVRGKKAYITLKSSNMTIEPFMEIIKNSQQYENVFIGKSEAIEIISPKSLLIIVDTYRGGFTEIPELLERTENIVVIDHHRKGTDFIQDAVLAYHEIYASSTCELVTEILQYVDDKLNLEKIEAEALYAGIIMDTKNFTYKTGVRTFEAASYLKRQGIDTISINQMQQKNVSTYLQISDIVRNSELVSECISISVCPPETNNAQIIAAKSADEMLTLSGIAAAFVLSKVNDQVYISGRSLGEINVQVILEKLGGGGHMTVAGAQLEGISIEEAKKKLKDVIMESH